MLPAKQAAEQESDRCRRQHRKLWLLCAGLDVSGAAITTVNGLPNTPSVSKDHFAEDVIHIPGVFTPCRPSWVLS